MTFVHVPTTLVPITSETAQDGTRFYLTPNGKRYPSVTTVLGYKSKAGLNEWRERVGEAEALKISRQATVRGTKVHLMTEQYLNNLPINVPKASFLDTMMFNQMKPILNRISNIRMQEAGLYSHHLRLAGRVDCIAEFDSKLSVIDFKTASQAKKPEWIESYFMQTAGYAIMWEELTGQPINRTVIIITVENDAPQLFIEKRNPWVKGLLDARDYFEAHAYAA